MRIEDVKIGMNVLCIDRNGYAYIQKGTIYEVCELDDYNHIGLKGIYGGVCVYHTGIFEPVPEPVVHKFHVCQPVRCITDILHPIKFGDVNIIRGINDEHEGHSLSFVAFPDNRSWMSQHFEPAYKLEVGCKVQVVNYNDSWNGTEGVVISEQSDTPDRWEVKNNMGGIIYFYSPHLIVLEPAPKNQTMKEFQKETQELFEKVEGVFHVGLLRKSMERYKKHVEETTGNILDDEGWATFGKVTINKGGNRMKTEEIKDIAKQLGDEYTGYEPDTGIITLKEMGKVTAEKTKVIIQMNDEDWIELLKKKGITKGISTFALTYTSPELTVEIATIEKVKKPKSSKKKE